MATGKEWLKKARKLSPEKAEEYQKAIGTLKNWGMFKKEYEWTGIFTLPYFLERSKHEKRTKKILEVVD